ncbi:DUF2891 family protein [Corynebacterium striatum]
MNAVTHDAEHHSDSPVAQLAQVAIDNVTRIYPYASHHVQTSSSDNRTPDELHPSFGNSFDWHSSVHMHWLLSSLLSSDEDASGAWRKEALRILENHLSAENIKTEADYLRANPTWERPYGWAWAVQLASELKFSPVIELQALAEGVAPLADAVFDNTLSWLGKASEPVRHGLHTNTAFGLKRIMKAAKELGREDVLEEILATAKKFFAEDKAWEFEQERSGQDFLSPGLCEADLMLDVLDDAEFANWAEGFLARLYADSHILKPAQVFDPTDGYQVHLYGLGMTVLASALRIFEATKDTHPELAQTIRERSAELLAPGLEAAITGDYMSSHWLATFAWEAHLEAERLNVPHPWARQ